MHHQTRLHALLPLICLGCLAAVAPSEAQSCGANWTNPVVCDVRIGVGAPGDRVQEILDDSAIEIPADSSVRLEVKGTDQFGYDFPNDRLLAQLEVDRGCTDLLSLEEDDRGRFTITAGTRRGTCRLFLWVPGNLNLEWPLDIEVISAFAEGYNRAHAELIATRLYQGILGRDPEPAGLQSQSTEILLGRLESVVDGMFASAEFHTNRRNRPPMQQLDDLYQALLGREVGADGIRSHLSQIERGEYSAVVLDILRSPEFEQILLDPTVR